MIEWMNAWMKEQTHKNATNSAVHLEFYRPLIVWTFDVLCLCWLITRHCLDLWSSPLFPESCIIRHKPVFDLPDTYFQYPHLMEGVDIASNMFFKDWTKLTTHPVPALLTTFRQTLRQRELSRKCDLDLGKFWSATGVVWALRAQCRKKIRKWVPGPLGLGLWGVY